MKTVIALVAIAGMFSSTASQYIAIAATHFGLAIRLQPITASGERLMIGMTTASYCPLEIEQEGGCSSRSGTNFGFGDGTLFMGAEVPGGQQVYIDPECGAVMHTQAHSAEMPEGAITNGWSLDQSENLGFLSHNDGLFACSTGADYTVSPWEVFVQLTGIDLGGKCLGIDAITTNETAPDAWEYL